MQPVLDVPQALERCGDFWARVDDVAPPGLRAACALQPCASVGVPGESRIELRADEQVVDRGAVLKNLGYCQRKNGLLIVEVQDVSLFLMPGVVQALGLVVDNLFILYRAASFWQVPGRAALVLPLMRRMVRRAVLDDILSPVQADDVAVGRDRAAPENLIPVPAVVGLLGLWVQLDVDEDRSVRQLFVRISVLAKVQRVGADDCRKLDVTVLALEPVDGSATAQLLVLKAVVVA